MRPYQAYQYSSSKYSEQPEEKELFQPLETKPFEEGEDYPLDDNERNRKTTLSSPKEVDEKKSSEPTTVIEDTTPQPFITITDGIDLDTYYRNGPDRTNEEKIEQGFECFDTALEYLNNNISTDRAITLLKYAASVLEAEFLYRTFSYLGFAYFKKFIFHQLPDPLANHEENQDQADVFKKLAYFHCEKTLKYYPSTLAKIPKPIKELLAYTYYVMALIEYYSKNFSHAYKHIQTSTTIHATIQDPKGHRELEWAQARTLYANIIAKMDNPPMSPMAVFQEVEQEFWGTKKPKYNPKIEAARFFEEFADYITHHVTQVADQKYAAQRYDIAYKLWGVSLNPHASTHMNRIQGKYLDLLSTVQTDKKNPFIALLGQEEKHPMKSTADLYRVLSQYKSTDQIGHRFVTFPEDIDIINREFKEMVEENLPYLGMEFEEYKEEPTEKSRHSPSMLNNGLQL